MQIPNIPASSQGPYYPAIPEVKGKVVFSLTLLTQLAHLLEALKNGYHR
jgi:hypothetical protein